MKKVFLIAAVFLTSQVFASEVNLKKTEFKWTGTKLKGKHFGKLPLKKYNLAYEAKGNKSELTGGEFILDLTQFTVDDLEGKWAQKFLTHMKSKDFFEISKWPEAKLIITKMDGEKATGELTIKDKTKEVTFPYTKKGKTYSGTLTFDRTKFGMVYGSGNFFKNLGDKLIHNEVNVDFKVTLK